MINAKTVALATLVAVALWFGWKLTARAAYESAAYTVLESEGSFEIRDYPELTVVTTSSPFMSSKNDGSFMRLFRYISGRNSDQQKVAMTVPVFMAPDAAAEDRNMGTMSFVLPSDVARAGAPAPAGSDVKVTARQGGTYAVVRFSGQLNRAAYRSAEGRLRAWMEHRELTGENVVEVAGYDPPWTPGPLRRNEVLIPLVTAVDEHTDVP